MSGEALPRPIASLISCRAGANPVAAFKEGERLFERNHTEEMGATDAGMLEGAIRIEEALEPGYAEGVPAPRNRPGMDVLT